MVQGTRTGVMLGSIFIRILPLAVTFLVAFFTTNPFYHLNVSVLDYHQSGGLFSLNLANWELAWILASVFWGAIIFGAIGQKIDYLFSGLICLFALWIYTYPTAVPFQMYLGLVGVAVLGNALGYMLKLGRERWLVKNKY